MTEEKSRLPCVCGSRALRSSDGLCYCERRPDLLDEQRERDLISREPATNE